jgi:hypothetical protein
MKDITEGLHKGSRTFKMTLLTMGITIVLTILFAWLFTEKIDLLSVLQTGLAFITGAGAGVPTARLFTKGSTELAKAKADGIKAEAAKAAPTPTPAPSKVDQVLDDEQSGWRSEPDRPVSTYFSLHEIIEGRALPAYAIKLNWQHFNEFDALRFGNLCAQLDQVRDYINDNFKSDTGADEIGLQVNAGFRCKAWELHRGRSGNSQHTLGALDVVPSGCSIELADEILADLDKKYSPRNVGWQGGFKRYAATIGEDGGIDRPGFAHFDNRGRVARW